MGRRFRVSLVALSITVCATAAAATPGAMAATTKPCGAVVRPYPGTRYEDVSLTQIRATGVSCVTARRVARRAHAKALGLAPDEDGIRFFSWNGWSVRGDLNGNSDHYRATRAGHTVSWRF